MKHAIPGQRWLPAAFAAMALLTASVWASAAPMHFVTNFTTLNNSGVTGSAGVTLNGNMLSVRINATGLEPNQTHAQHLHGPFDANGNPTQATTPTMALDTNHDGVLEVVEGLPAYGPILVPLTPFQTAPNGVIDYSQTFDLTDSAIYFGGAKESDLFPLNFREIVIHGLTAPIDITNGGLDGKTFFAKGSYDPFIPVASGVLVASVPEPAGLAMMVGGLGLMWGIFRVRRRNDA